jgi:hypothetical protein
MALSQATLQTELLKLLDETDLNFVGWPTDPATAASNWSTAYNNYASSAVDVSGDSLLLSFPALFETALLSTMIPNGTIVDAAQAFETAFQGYWTGATFNIGLLPPNGIPVPPNPCSGFFSLEITSVVILVTPNILKNLLLTELAVLSSNAATKATALATAFHTATLSAVNVLISGLDTTVPPPVGPFPIINNNFVY